MSLMLLIVLHLAFHARASQITGHGSTLGDYGGEAHFKCQLENPKDVLQVTWQRLYKDNSIEDLATYSKRFGEQVNDPHKGKIAFTETSLQSSSITVRNVTWEDEGCYLCSFNAYPGGSKRHKTCLKVQGVSDVQKRVYEPNGENTVIFSCSVTGKPAPKINWDSSRNSTGAEYSQTSAVQENEDLTVTSSSNITLRLPPNWEEEIYCVINSGMRGERRERMVYNRHKDDKEKEASSTTLQNSIIFIIITCITLFVSAAFVSIRWFKSSHHLPVTLDTSTTMKI